MDICVLIVEDKPEDQQLLFQTLQQGGYKLSHRCVETLQDLAAALEAESWDLIFAGELAGGSIAFEMLRLLAERELEYPLIIFSAPAGESAALAGMHAGARDYILKDNPARLIPAVARELNYNFSRREHRRAEAALRNSEQRSRWGMEIMSYLAQSNELPWVVQMVLLKVLEITGFEAGAIRLYRGDNYSFVTREDLPEHFFQSLGESANAGAVCSPGLQHGFKAHCILEKAAVEGIDITATNNVKVFKSAYGSMLVGRAANLVKNFSLQSNGNNTCSSCIKAGYETFVQIPLKTVRKTIGLLYLFHQKPHFLDREGLDFLETVVHPLGYAIKHMQDQGELKESYNKIQALSAKLLRAYEKERARLARELHDEVGQTLTALKLDMQLLERDLQEPGITVSQRLAQSIDLMNTVMDLIHAQAVSLRPPALTDMGLLAAVRNMTERYSRRAGIPVYISDEGWGENRFPGEVETALFRCVQESLTNVVRHARAKRVDIIFKHEPGKLVLQIKDDGVGFDPEARFAKEERIGLAGMQERVELINGTMKIVSRPGEGTLIKIKVQLASAKR